MSSESPAYALSVLGCDPSQSDCFQPDNIDWVAGERYNEVLGGCQDLAHACLAGWDMADRNSLTLNRHQIYIYAAPCVHSLEAAFSVSICIRRTVTALFRAEAEAEKPHPSLPCKIRIDDRLLQRPCGCQPAPQRMGMLLQVLRDYTADKRQIDSFPARALFILRPGPWTADHFDIPYIDRRCYELHNSPVAAAPVSLAALTGSKSSRGVNIGNLILASSPDVESFLRTSAPAETAPRVQLNTMFELMPKAAGQEWTSSYHGTYELTRPALADAERQRRDREQYDREHNQQQSGIRWGMVGADDQETKKAAKFVWGKAKAFRAKYL